MEVSMYVCICVCIALFQLSHAHLKPMTTTQRIQTSLIFSLQVAISSNFSSFLDNADLLRLNILHSEALYDLNRAFYRRHHIHVLPILLRKPNVDVSLS